jgi:transcriptional regulator with XRE-family HTH domain
VGYTIGNGGAAMKNDDLGVYLKELRLLGGLSIRGVERETNGAISNAYLSQLESGNAGNPSPAILNLLATIYKVPLQEMMEKAGHIKPSSGENKRSGIALRINEDITSDERKQLLTYLQFIRSQRNSKVHAKR